MQSDLLALPDRLCGEKDAGGPPGVIAHRRFAEQFETRGHAVDIPQFVERGEGSSQEVEGILTPTDP